MCVCVLALSLSCLVCSCLSDLSVCVRASDVELDQTIYFIEISRKPSAAVQTVFLSIFHSECIYE